MNENCQFIHVFTVHRPERVAEAVAKIIESGKCGDVWVTEDNKPPYSVRPFEDFRSLKIADHE